MGNCYNKNGRLLVNAAKCGDIEDVKFYLVEKNADVNYVNRTGSTALHEASENGYIEIVNYLISRGANVDAISSRGDERFRSITPLICAVSDGHVEIAKILIQNGANTNHLVDGRNLLDKAIFSDNPEMIRLIMSHGFDINQRNELLLTPLATAIGLKACESTRFLLENGADYRKISTFHCLLPIYFGLYDCDKGTECTELLLDYIEEKEGKEGMVEYINSNDNYEGFTALHKAIYMNNFQAAKLLLERGAEPNKGEIHFYIEQVKSENISGDVLLVDLAHLQYRWLKGLVDSPNKGSSYREQQEALRVEILRRVNKVKRSLMRIDERSATVLLLKLIDFVKMDLDDRSESKLYLALVVVYLLYLLLHKTNKSWSRRSSSSSEEDNSRDKYAYVCQLIQTGIEESDSLEELKEFLRYLVLPTKEQSYKKQTAPETENVNSRWPELEKYVGRVETFCEFSTLVKYGNCPDLDDQLVKEFICKFFPAFNYASLLIMNKIETDGITKFLDKCKNQKLKDYLENIILKLEELGAAGIRETIDRMRKDKNFPRGEVGKLFSQFETNLKTMKTNVEDDFAYKKAKKYLEENRANIREVNAKLAAFVRKERN